MIKADFGHNGKPRICFVAHNVYGALAGKDTGHIGGIEQQQSLMARWLAKRGYQVSMIAWDEGQEDGVEIHGVRVFKMCAKDSGLKGLRFFWPKWTSLRRAMRRANADIYYYNCGDLGLGQVVMWCHRHGRKCVYSVASNPDCDPKLPVLKPLRERILYRFGLKRVDSLIVQTQYQQQMLLEGFGITSTVIPMPCERPSNNEKILPETANEESVNVLWIGRISKEKRFEWLLDVAVKCPQIIFNVIGAANTESDYASNLTKRASGIRNVKMHGRIPHQEMSKYYRSSKILCCTSAYEGFPNTFLEAWSVGIPVVSTFDPDDVIQKKGLGTVVYNLEEIVSGLKEFIQSRETWQRASKAAKQYYMENHAIDVSLPRFERLFLDVAGYKS